MTDLNDMSAATLRFQTNLEQMTATGTGRLAVMGRSVATLSNQIDRVGDRALRVGASFGMRLGRDLIATAAEFERLGLQMEALEGSAEKGHEAMKWAQEFAARTPMDFQAVTTSIVKLRSFGLDPMDGTLQALVDQTAKLGGSGETLKDVVSTLGQAWAKQKFESADALHLIENGVPVWELLSKASGKNADQLRRMAESGELGRESIRQLIGEMGRGAEGAAARLAGSWDGMVAQLRNQWTGFGAAVMEAGTFDYLKGELSGLLELVNQLQASGQLDESARRVSEELINGLKIAKEFGTGLWEVMQQAGKAASFIAELVGGYDNLAKGLAYLYAANKLLQVGGAASGALRGAGSLVPVPVYIVGGPGSRGAGDLSDIFKKGGKGPGARIPGGTPGGVIKPSMLRLLATVPLTAWPELLGTTAAGGAMGTAGLVAGGVALAGLAGYGAGTLINKGIETWTPATAEKIGEAMAKALAAMGNEEARQALEFNRNARLQIEIVDKNRQVKVNQLFGDDLGLDVVSQVMRTN